MKFIQKKTFSWVDEWLNDGINGYFDPSLKRIIHITTAEQKNILRRLKENADTMAPVYSEIESKITDRSTPRGNGGLGRRAVLTAIVDAAIVYEEKRKIKKDRKDLEEAQEDIAKLAGNLIKLLDKHTKIKEESYLTSAANTCPLYLFERAGLQTGTEERQFLFKGHIKPLLEKIDGGLRMGKYTPRIQDVLTALKYEMESPITGCRSEVDAISDSRKTSYADFVRGLEDCIMQDRDFCYNLPYDFKLTNDSLAAIVQALFVDEKEGDSIRRAKKRTPKKRNIRE